MNPPVLIVLTASTRKTRQAAEPETLVGRDEGAKLRIASTESAASTAMLVIVPEGVLVRDLGSRNSTFINGAPAA